MLQTPHPRWELLLLRGSKTDCSVHDTISYRGARDQLLLLIVTWPKPEPAKLFLPCELSVPQAKLVVTWLPNKLPESLISFLFFRLPVTIVIDPVEWSQSTGPEPLSVVWQRALSVCLCGLFFSVPEERKWGSQASRLFTLPKSYFQHSPEACYFNFLWLRPDWPLLRDPGGKVLCKQRMGGTVLCLETSHNNKNSVYLCSHKKRDGEVGWV